MKVRIKFAKFGEMKFIGHLDMMRYFQKAMRRADIDIAFTEGFSPHMVMSFALPLGVGVTSDAEYMDIEVRTPICSAEATERLNRVMVHGVRVLSFREIPEGRANNGMTLVSAARYLVGLRDECAADISAAAAFADAFLAQPQIIAAKKSKSGEREEDIRPLILRMTCEKDGSLDMTLAAGSKANVKPELVSDAFFRFAGCEIPASAYRIHRAELYTMQDGRLTALEELGWDIEP